MAVLFACLSPCLRAQASDYSVSIPYSGPVARLAAAVGYATGPTEYRDTADGPFEVGGWIVNIEYDPIHCDISCSYRRKRDAWGRATLAALLPPVALIQIHPPGAPIPASLTVDPAGLQFPFLTSRSTPVFAGDCVSGKSLSGSGLVALVETPPQSHSSAPFGLTASAAVSHGLHISPLRI